MKTDSKGVEGGFSVCLFLKFFLFFVLIRINVCSVLLEAYSYNQSLGTRNFMLICTY